MGYVRHFLGVLILLLIVPPVTFVTTRLIKLSAWLMDHEKFYAEEKKKFEEKNNIKIW